MVLLIQKLVLTNGVLFINISSGNDKLLRIIVGLLIAVSGLTLQLITRPFRKQSDHILNFVVQLMLVFFFALGLLLKLCATDGTPALAPVQDACTTLVGVSSAYNTSVVMICAGLMVVMILIIMFFHQLLIARTVSVLLDASTMEPPTLLLREGERYHIFLCVTAPRSAQEPLCVPSSLETHTHPKHTCFLLAGATSGLPAKINAP